MRQIKRLTPILLLATFIIAFFHFPLVYAYKLTSSDRVFSGQASWFDPWDINVYVSAIKWSQENGTYFQNAYTTHPHKSVIIYPLYTLLGILFSNYNPILIYTVAKVVLGFVLIIVIYKLAKVFLRNKKESLVATFLICLGGGFGWVTMGKLYLPDIAITPFTYLSTFERPHEILAVAFYLSSLALIFKGITKDEILVTLSSAILFNTVLLFYPFYILSYYAITLVFSILKFRLNFRKILIHFSFVFSLTFPFAFAYSFYLRSGNGFENVFSPNLPTPNLLSVAFGYGILTLTFLYQLKRVKTSDARLFLNIWFLISLAFAYLPLGFSRYFLRALFFPLALIALMSLNDVSKILHISKGWMIKILIVIVPMSSLGIFLARIILAHDKDNPWYYVTTSEYRASEYLDSKSKNGEGVIVAYPLANWIPTKTHNRVYFGHYYQTPNSEEKVKNLKVFYSGEYSSVEALRFLEENNIRYILWSEKERRMSNEGEEQTTRYDFLKSFYKNEEVEIFTY